MDTIADELSRVNTALAEQDERPHWMAVGVLDNDMWYIEGSNGATTEPHRRRFRSADIDIRVGTPTLDNTHKIRDAGWFDVDEKSAFSLPLDDEDEEAIRLAVWRAADSAYRAARKRLIRVRTNQAVKVAREDNSADFSSAPIATVQRDAPALQLDEIAWQDSIRSASARLATLPHIEDSHLSVSAERVVRTIVTTEGTQLSIPHFGYRLSIWARTTAEDGMNLAVSEGFDSHSVTGLPDESRLNKAVDTVADKLLALRQAPVVDPTTAPAILYGRAAAVFFHEVLGHRVEGHRQKDEDEGQTFTDKVGEIVLPTFISVHDDPTIARFNNTDLNGHYTHDDEGVLAQRVGIVENGILRSFLTSRSPIAGFPSSNGHGRRQLGHAVVARQGNLIVSAQRTVSRNRLRQKLIQEIRRHDSDHGFIFEDITGGFTFTGRVTPNAFAVQPVTVYRVWADGRPDELVRGVDLIGTPLTTFQQIIAASDSPKVFNGSCGAESGWVPVSAIAPDLLIREVEVQRSEKANDRPPLLAAPVVIQ
jgi:TldD protein